MNLAISEARLEDLNDLLDLYRQLHLEDPPIEHERAENVWNQILATDHRTVLLAHLGPLLVGSVEYSIWQNLTRSARPYILIENMIVDRNHRRLAIGSSLMTEVNRRCSKIQPYKFQLAVALDGPTAFYESCGYANDGFVMKLRPR